MGFLHFLKCVPLVVFIPISAAGITIKYYIVKLAVNEEVVAQYYNDSLDDMKLLSDTLEDLVKRNGGGN